MQNNISRELRFSFFRIVITLYNEDNYKGEIIMIKEVTILEQDARDFRLATELDKMETRLDQRMVEARRKGLMVGFGTTVVCVKMGGVVTKVIVAK
jgi:hypothetical protein